jgi:hypothetical protein
VFNADRIYTELSDHITGISGGDSPGSVSGRDLPGAELARAFHADVVAPLLARAAPRLRYAAGRLGSGSDVLGLDDAMSRDHDWGCRPARGRA